MYYLAIREDIHYSVLYPLAVGKTDDEAFAFIVRKAAQFGLANPQYNVEVRARTFTFHTRDRSWFRAKRGNVRFRVIPIQQAK